MITVTPGILRADNSTDSFASAVTIRAFFSTVNPLSTASMSFVFGAFNTRSSRTTMLFSTTLVANADLIAKRRTFLGSLYA